MPKLDKAEELLTCIFKGLMYDSAFRMGDLKELLTILETYKDYQNLKCRFSHGKYYEEIMCLAKNPNIKNIDKLFWENELMSKPDDNNPTELFGVSVLQASIKTGYVETSSVVKMCKARTPKER